MNNIKKDFTIKDLENLSGTKAHTIRIWEKRYQLLQPRRTAGNIRYYDTNGLLKLLNVVLLKNNNFRISEIASLSDEAIFLNAREIGNKSTKNNNAINSLKIAMFNFDQQLFNEIYGQLLLRKNFKDVFRNVFIPFLNHLGLLWQTDSLSPAYEHFISNLISQKIQTQIEKTQQHTLLDTTDVCVLFLPENEMHELGLLYLNYELSLKGKKIIYLGQRIPLESLSPLVQKFNDIHFISSFTVAPIETEIESYMYKMEALISNTKHQFSVFGPRVSECNSALYNSRISFYRSLKEFLDEM